MKDLNFKRMASDMSLKDKAKIIFASWNHEKESENKERLITVQEEEAMIRDIRKKDQIDEYNRLIDLYNMSIFAVFGISAASLQLKLAITKTQTLALAMFLHGETNDQLETLLCIVCEADRKSLIEEKKLKINTFNELLDYFQPEDELQSLNTREPNHHIQMIFERLVQTYKVLRQKLCGLDYILGKAEMDFLGEVHKAVLQEAQEQLKYVEDLDGLLNILTIYKKALELDLMRKDNFHKPSFLELLQDHKKVLQLSDKEKGEAEEEIEKYIAAHN
jgi:hypothetical protein